MSLLGLGGLDHDGAAAVVDRGAIVAALEAERVTRRKSAGLSDEATVEALLDALDVRTVRAIAIADRTFWEMRRGWLLPLLERRFGKVPLVIYLHHDCHLQAALAASPWASALCVGIDGKGDGVSTTAAVVARDGPRGRLLEVSSAHSLGRLWWAVSEYCGLPGHHSAGKTMALAAYGRARELFEPFVELDPDGGFRLVPRGVHADTFRQVPRIVSWLAETLREPAGSLHADAAASLQRLTERVVKHVVGAVVRRSGIRSVCLAGGVALNGIANQALVDDGIVDGLFVPPCTDDRGLALGAAAALAGELGEPIRPSPDGIDPFLGPAPRSIDPPHGWRRVPDGVHRVADHLIVGRVVGSFRGGDEAGPRALGHRSLLASPVPPGMREYLNAAIKHREPFRPFGCSIKIDRVGAWFEIEGTSPYMVRIARVRTGRAVQIPAALHVDGTSRIQTVAPDDSSGLWPILCELERRGHPPLVINTSLNGRGEPMVHQASEAFDLLERLGLDALLLDGELHVRG